eukprot:1182550-Prorocentrum_minimum.AAC.1
MDFQAQRHFVSHHPRTPGLENGARLPRPVRVQTTVSKRALRSALELHGPCESKLKLASGTLLCDGLKGYQVKRIKEAYPKAYEYSDLASHPAIVIVPYQLGRVVNKVSPNFKFGD